MTRDHKKQDDMQLKELGFSKSRCAKQLGINRETVTR